MSAYREEDYLALSGIQHFRFCPRQWALIHIERAWADNLLTAQGELLHERAHDPTLDEKRGDRLISRGMPVASATLGVRGACDVVEFVSDPGGVAITGRRGKWLPTPIEYKRGDGSAIDADALQLCAQALCLEEMLCCEIARGFVFYAEIRRREEVVFSDELRQETERTIARMHELYDRGYTPKVKRRPGCRSCSLRDLCLPALGNLNSAAQYIRRAVGDEGKGDTS